jgi:Coenzyme A transferase
MDAQEIIARRIARELRSGMLVNLGIGIPTLVTNYLPTGITVFFQSENGLIGTGPVPEPGMGHPTLTDAAGRPVTALPGACTFDGAMSFGLIRGGHVDLTVLGGLSLTQPPGSRDCFTPDGCRGFPAGALSKRGGLAANRAAWIGAVNGALTAHPPSSRRAAAASSAALSFLNTASIASGLPRASSSRPAATSSW